MSDSFDPPPSPWATYNGAFDQAFGSLRILVNGLNILARTDPFPPDQFSECTLPTPHTPTLTQVFVRRNAATLERYGFGSYRDGGLRWWYIKRDGKVGAPYLYRQPLNIPEVGGDTLRVEVVGTTITGYLNDQFVAQASDTVLTAGAPGMAGVPDPGPVPAAICDTWRGGAA